MTMKPYQQVPIEDCHDPLVAIPLAQFAVELPHPYMHLGAPYGDRSPYYLRQGVLERLQQAQLQLQQTHPGWRIQIFDAYRPIAVQQFMVDQAIDQAIQSRGWRDQRLSDSQQQEILQQVQQFWATPSLDPATPPPHSTGAAIDVTLSDAAGQTVDMGSPIDEMSPRSHPDYYAIGNSQAAGDAQSAGNTYAADDANQSQYHQNRLLLRQVMLIAGFQQHPQEWWHFSYGDQLWAWLCAQQQPHPQPIARYGAI